MKRRMVKKRALSSVVKERTVTSLAAAEKEEEEEAHLLDRKKITRFRSGSVPPAIYWLVSSVAGLSCLVFALSKCVD